MAAGLSAKGGMHVEANGAVARRHAADAAQNLAAFLHHFDVGESRKA